MKIKPLLQEIRQFCQQNADPVLAQKYARYFTEGYDAYGVHSDRMQDFKKSLLEKYRDKLTLDDVIELGRLLMQSGKYEEASFALLLTEAYQDQYTAEAFQKIGGWLDDGIRNWGHTDCLCSMVFAHFFEKGIVHRTDMASWRESTSKWKRRAVPVALIPTLKKEKNIKSVLAFVEPLMQDGDRFMHQGLGWFLREAWKKYPEPVEAFLLKWKETAARKIYQYATEKMEKGEKERFRRGKTIKK